MQPLPEFVITAKEFAEQPLGLRFHPYDLTLSLLIDQFALPRLLRRIVKNYHPIEPIPHIEADRVLFQQQVRQQFAPRLIDPLFDPDHPPPLSGHGFAEFQAWVKTHCPDDVATEAYSRFALTIFFAWANWLRRRHSETTIVLGLLFIVRSVVLCIYFLILFSMAILLRGNNWQATTFEASVTILAFVVAGLESKRRSS